MNALTRFYFEIGHYAYQCGEPYDKTESFIWKQGWKAAKAEACS